MPTSIRLDPDLEQRLDNLASSTGRTKSFYIKRIIEEGIDRAEYEYGILRDAEAYRAGKLETYTLDEVKAHYGLDD